MNLGNVAGVMQMAYQKVNQTKETTAGNIGFAESLQGTANSGTEKVDAYKGYLEQKYGTTIIQSVGKDQKSIDNIGSGTAGTGNVVIAPNILEQMQNGREFDSAINFYIVGQTQTVVPAVSAYEKAISTISSSIIQGI